MHGVICAGVILSVMGAAFFFYVLCAPHPWPVCLVCAGTDWLVPKSPVAFHTLGLGLLPVCITPLLPPPTPHPQPSSSRCGGMPPFGEISSEMDRKEWRPTCISAVSTQLTKCCGIGELPNLLTQPTPSHHPCSRHSHSQLRMDTDGVFPLIAVGLRHTCIPGLVMRLLGRLRRLGRHKPPEWPSWSQRHLLARIRNGLAWPRRLGLRISRHSGGPRLCSRCACSGWSEMGWPNPLRPVFIYVFITFTPFDANP
jgi:hypothetical protein